MIVSITASAWSSLMTSASRTNPPVRIDVSNGGAEGYYKVGGQPQWSPWRKRVSHNHVKGHIRYRNVTIDCPHCISPPNLVVAKYTPPCIADSQQLISTLPWQAAAFKPAQ